MQRSLATEPIFASQRSPAVSLCLGVFVVIPFLLGCSQNEYSTRGITPTPPKSPREARVMQKDPAGGMNTVAAPEGEQQAQPASGGGAVYTGTATLTADLAKRFKPGETLFVILRDDKGSPTPLAAEKIVVQSFPYRFTVSDQNAMMGGALPQTAEVLLRLDADGDLTTKGPDDMVAGPLKVAAGEPFVLPLQEPPK